jgi:hypothetical protein
VLPGCSRENRAGKLPLPVDAGAAEKPPDPALRLVAVLSTLRREPHDSPRTRAEGAKGPGTNSLALLHRGEQATFVESQGDWTRIRASDGVEGWVRSSALVPAADVHEGTVLDAAWAFDRPDLLAVNARRKLDPGTILFIRKTKDLFTEVDAGPGPSIWVLTDRISTQPADLEASKLVEKARFLRRNERPDEAREVLALLRSRQPGSPLLPALAEELGEVPPDGGAPVPPSGPSGPSGIPGPSGAP